MDMDMAGGCDTGVTPGPGDVTLGPKRTLRGHGGGTGTWGRDMEMALGDTEMAQERGTGDRGQRGEPARGCDSEGTRKDGTEMAPGRDTGMAPGRDMGMALERDTGTQDRDGTRMVAQDRSGTRK